jgi:DnaK suppressor protein
MKQTVKRAKRSPDRRTELTRLLARARADTLARVRALRGDQAADEVTLPADEMDVARTLAEVETHASLIERAQDRLNSIDEAAARLERGIYGKCDRCGEEIPLERLQAMPFARYCVDCQGLENRTARGAGALSRSFAKRWTTPPEVDESLERQDEMLAPEEDLSVHDDTPFGREEPDLELTPGPSRRRGRPRTRAVHREE